MPYLLINNENLSIEETSCLVLNLLNLVLDNKDNFDVLKEIFSIENLSGIEMYSFKEITELISDKINGNVSKEKTKVLRKRSDNDETNNY